MKRANVYIVNRENVSWLIHSGYFRFDMVVIDELSSFKKENTERGKTARVVLKWIREMAESSIGDMESSYRLCAAIEVPDCDQVISILPVHKDFRKCLPFCPSDDDMDGQIILTALEAKLLVNGKAVDGTESASVIARLNDSRVTLLTNDNGLAIRARERGIVTSRFGYKYPAPYTGRRDLIVPKDLFTYFYSEKELDMELWTEYMPLEAPLVANEFISMRLEDPHDYPLEFVTSGNPYRRHIGREEGLPVIHADDHRAVLSRGVDLARIVLEHQRQRV